MSWKYFTKSKLSKDRMYQVIRRPVITEKATMVSEFNQIIFEVERTASKPDIRAAIEGLFGVTVTKVNTVSVRPKTKRFRGRLGVRPGWRKAIITLKDGDHIDVMSGL